MPKVSSITKSETTLVFKGTNFFTADFDASSVLDGVKADSVVVDSATQITATWSKGVPALKLAKKPELSFKTKTLGVLTHFSIISEEVT